MFDELIGFYIARDSFFHTMNFPLEKFWPYARKCMTTWIRSACTTCLWRTGSWQLLPQLSPNWNPEASGHMSRCSLCSASLAYWISFISFPGLFPQCMPFSQFCMPDCPVFAIHLGRHVPNVRTRTSTVALYWRVRVAQPAAHALSRRGSTLSLAAGPSLLTVKDLGAQGVSTRDVDAC